MKKLINRLRESNEDMGIVYMLWVIPFYLLGIIFSVLISAGLGYGIYKLVLTLL